MHEKLLDENFADLAILTPSTLLRHGQTVTTIGIMLTDAPFHHHITIKQRREFIVATLSLYQPLTLRNVGAQTVKVGVIERANPIEPNIDTSIPGVRTNTNAARADAPTPTVFSEHDVVVSSFVVKPLQFAHLANC